MDKDKSIKKWEEFIINNKKLFEDFKNKSFPVILKKICSIIRKDIVNSGDKSFNKNYNIDAFNLNIIVDYHKGSKEPYYANINIYDILTKPNDLVVIPVKVTDHNINVNYLMSIISHEIRHIYDIYTVSGDVEIQDFIKSITTFKYKNKYPEFTELVYLSLEHELIARHNMLYEMYRYINITDKNKLLEIFRQSFAYEALLKLQNFNHKNFIEKDGVLEFTKEFSESIKDHFDGNLETYYEKWNIFFKEKSEEFLNYIDVILDDIIDDVKNNKTYERLCGFISYNEDIGSKISHKLFKKMVKNKNENFKL